MKYFLPLLTLIASATTANAADLKIKLTDLRNNEGNIAIAIHNNETAFIGNDATNAPYTMLINTAGSKTITLHDFPAGKYAISILHDENKDDTLNTTEHGFPTEGYAYSNNVGKLSIPSFNKASFTHSTDTDTTQIIKMLYIK